MKFIYIIFIAFLAFFNFTRADVTDNTNYNNAFFSDVKIQRDELKKVKYYLLNGETRLAKAILFKLSYVQTKLRPVILRYLSILSFTENDFDKTYEYLSEPSMLSYQHFHKICALRTLSEIVLNKRFELESNWERCKVENSGKFSESHLIWMDTLVKLKLYSDKQTTTIPFKRAHIASLNNGETKIILKLALYLNQEKIVVNQLPEMTFEQFQDPEIQEIAGQIFYKSGELVNSYRLVKDLSSPNSENTKGNFLLKLNKNETAYEQFKHALEKKINSQNAIERIIPLTWLLGDWENGIKYTKLVSHSPKTFINRLTLLSAFLVKGEKYSEAENILDRISYNSKKGEELEVSQLLSFTTLMLNKVDESKKYARRSCSLEDLVNCWLSLQFSQWEAFPTMINREDAISKKDEWKSLTKEEIQLPLDEEIFVNQKDIEELDDAQLKSSF